MTACQIRVLSNGYLVSYMENNELREYCFMKEDDMIGFLRNCLFQPGEVE